MQSEDIRCEEIRRLSDRLDKLESQNRWLKRTLLVLLAVPLLVASLGAAAMRAADDEVVTKLLIITDGDRNRIAMGVNEDGLTFINVFIRFLIPLATDECPRVRLHIRGLQGTDRDLLSV